MCGIAGLFSPDEPSRMFDRSVLLRMTDAVTHRGPDEAGMHVEPGVAFGHRRLAIIDVAGGQQPIFNEDETVVLVFNGEIYNFRELAAELQAAGHVFRTRSDAEVIVHAWEQWGAASVRRFRGMFALALWDRNQRTLFLARDRLGIKPLFYAWLADGSLAFGSELKCLAPLPDLDRRIDDRAVEDFFAYGYIPDPRTIYRGALKLPPACTLVCRMGQEQRSSRPTPQPYWDVHFEPDARITMDEASAELRARLAEAVRIRMISEVPLGAFLSGGVDSSAVVASMAGLGADPLKTCSIAFNVASHDESDYAAMVAAQYRTDHQVEQVRSDDFSLIERLVDLYDEPYADSSALPTWRVCQLARQRVTVALSGDGGDETFGGYRRYRLHRMEEKWRASLPATMRRMIFGPLGEIYPKLDWMPRVFRGKTTFQALARDSVDAYFHTISVLRDEERRALYSSDFRHRLGGYEAVEVLRRHALQAPTDQALALIQYLDYKTYLPGDINTKVDRASMAHALEVRVPFLDHTLIEWAARLPEALKLAGGEGKRVLKKAFEPLLPHEILYRQKMGFAVPLADWFRGPLNETARQALTGERMGGSGFFDPGTLQRIYTEHTSGRRDWGSAIWSLICFDRFLARQETMTVAETVAA